MIAPSRQIRLVRSMALPFAIVLAGVTFWWLHNAFQQRHWQAFTHAGERALERRNYDWAEKMYQQALQYAQTNKDEDKIVRSYLLLHQLYKLQGQEERAVEMANLVRQLRPVQHSP